MSDAAFFNEWYACNRARSEALFDLVADETYYSRPMSGTGSRSIRSGTPVNSRARIEGEAAQQRIDVSAAVV